MSNSIWIARDKSGSLFVYDTKPNRGEKRFEPTTPRREIVQEDHYPELTWENSPKELVIKETISDNLEKELNDFFLKMELKNNEYISEETFRNIALHFINWKR